MFELVFPSTEFLRGYFAFILVSFRVPLAIPSYGIGGILFFCIDNPVWLQWSPRGVTNKEELAMCQSSLN